MFPVSSTMAMQLNCSKYVILNQQSHRVRIWSELYKWCVCIPPGCITYAFVQVVHCKDLGDTVILYDLT